MAKLRLQKERLAELTTDELHRVAGGTDDIPTVLMLCASRQGTCPSVDACTTAQSCGCQPTWNCY